ncbi:AAA family ATPase [Jannaschia aquimarina]|nr:AAA family ATPase [Jannaschia aquimarina]
MSMPLQYEPTPTAPPLSSDKVQAALIADLPRQLAIRVLGPNHLATDQHLLGPDDWWRSEEDELLDDDEPDAEQMGEVVARMTEADQVGSTVGLDLPVDRPELSGADRTKAFLAWQLGAAIRAALVAAPNLDPRRLAHGGAVLDLRVATHLDHGDHVRAETIALKAVVDMLRKLLGAPDRPTGRITFESVLGLSDDDPGTDPLTTKARPKRRRSPAPGNAPVARPVGEWVARESLDYAAIGHFVVCLTDRDACLPPEVDAVLDLKASLEPLTREDMTGLIGLTHGIADHAAEANLRQRLPSDADLCSLSTASVLAALAGPTASAVAERLAKMTEIAEERRPVAGDNAAGGEGKSQATGGERPTSSNRLTLADVKGQDAVVEELRGIAADMRLWESDTIAWSDLVSSVILHGPPGTGKTMAAEALAGELGVPLIDASVGTAQSKGPLSSVLAAFEAAVTKAEASAPCVLLMDELDSLMPRDNERDNGYMRLLVNAVLEALTRIQSMEGVILVGATNDLRMIDPAIRRSGRFDLKLRMANPDLTGIRAIVRAELGDAADPRDAPALNAALVNLIGRSGADAAMVARRAKGLARRGASERGEAVRITVPDLAVAVADIAPPLDLDDLRRIAIHEAGHALVGAACGLGLPRAVRVAGEGGVAAFPPRALRTSAVLRVQILTTLAGREAERLVFGDVSTGAASDLATATMIVLEAERQCGMGSEGIAWEPLPAAGTPLSEAERRFVNERLEPLSREVAGLLAHHRATLLAIADRLVADRDLDTATIEALLASLAKNHLPEPDGSLYASGESRGDHDDTSQNQDPSDRRLTTPVSRARQAHPPSEAPLP